VPKRGGGVNAAASVRVSAGRSSSRSTRESYHACAGSAVRRGRRTLTGHRLGA
jgi:hypothetical protein